MRKYLFALVITVLTLIGAKPAFASHIVGLDLYYEYISGTNYRVSMAVYGDCAGSAFPNLPTSTPQVELTNGGSLAQTFLLDLEGPGVEVTPVCQRELANTTCSNPNSTLPGIKRFIYSKVISIGSISSNWNFRFTGNMGGNNSAGRSSIITNIAISPTNGSVTILDAQLNNTQGPNSSPRFTTLPTPFYCVNVFQQYNQGSVDPNGDSLVFALAPALEQGGVPASYQPGFSPTNPISTSTPIFFDPATGQFNFTPNVSSQGYVIVNKVDEYRNGVKVGSATREMTFVIRPDCGGNNPPAGGLDTTSGRANGGLLAANNTYNVCEGTSLVKFEVNPTDRDADSIEVLINGLPTGANAIITNNHTPNPKVSFSWNTASVAPGAYNFFISYKDNGCPISSQQTQAFTINIVRPNQLASQLIFPTECAHKAQVKYNLSYGLLPRTITIKQNGNTLKTLTDNTGTVLDSLDAGTYNLVISSPNLLCPTNVNVVVRDSGTYPYLPILPDAFYCLNDVPVAMTATPAANGTIFWFDSLGTRLPGAPIPNTATPGIFHYYASQLVKVCESLRDTALVYVTKRPVADFIITPSPICARDTATVSFTGTIGVGPILDYKWNWGPVHPISGDTSGPYQISWYNPGVYTIRLQVFENKCPSDSIEKTIRVKPRPAAAFTMNSNLCAYDSVLVRYSSPDSLAGQQYAWDFDGATIPQSTQKGPFYLHWTNAGTKVVRLGVTLDGCTDTVSHTTDAHASPEARIANVAGSVCLGDKILLEYVTTGPNNTYTWLPKDQIRIEADGAPSTRVYTAPTTYTLVVTNEFSCMDSARITYTNVKPCCQFSYPNAFTPNNDGRNDKFRVNLYGNQEYYDLSIYNRWGQRVFHTAEPAVGWDGTSDNKPCDMGVYFYVLKAKCLTGHEEEQKGELTLIR